MAAQRSVTNITEKKNIFFNIKIYQLNTSYLISIHKLLLMFLLINGKMCVTLSVSSLKFLKGKSKIVSLCQEVTVSNQTVHFKIVELSYGSRLM